jgi:CRP/FNR family transcriptional regulator, cyclic AMP receptor protein
MGKIRIDLSQKTRLIGQLDRNKVVGTCRTSGKGRESSRMATMAMEKGRFLGSPLLAGVDESSRRAVFRRLVEGRAPSGTALLSQGKPNDRLWFVFDGSVTLERKQADGHIDILATLDGPAIYGTTTFFRSTAPSATLRAASDLTLWTLDREGHEALRREDPRAAEALALAVVKVLSERFDLLDSRISQLMAEHGDDHPRSTELAAFRARLFEEPAL